MVYFDKHFDIYFFRHLSRVEILKILIEANWHHIPTMQELTQVECLR